MWPLKTAFLFLFCPGFWCHDCNKTKLHFVSKNFFRELYWDEVHIPGQEVLYTVQYKPYGESVWSEIMGCQNISELFCDLSSVMRDVYGRYFVRVMVNGSCMGKYMNYIPVEQTVLGAPEVSLTVSDSSLTVIITTPPAPHNQSITEISRNWSGKPHINYELQLTNSASGAKQKIQNSSGVITVISLELNTEYCGTAFYMWTHPSSPKQSENTTFCTTLPGKSWMHILVVPGVLALFLLIILALALCQLYVMRKQRLPDMLKKMNPKRDTPPYYTDLKVKIDVVRIYSESPWNFAKPHPGVFPVVERPLVKSNGSSYAAQDCGGLPWEGNSYANQHVALVENSDSSNASSTSYGLVVPEDVEESPNSPNSSGLGDSIGSDGLVPMTLCSGGCGEPVQDLNRCSELDKALVLPVLRGEGGKLEFSLIGTSSLLANIPEVQQMAPVGERTLLLTDLVTEDEMESSDSGFASDYGRTYIPNYVQQNFTEMPCTHANPLASSSDFTSTYRQNWVPGIPLESHLSEQMTELDKEEEEEADDEEENEEDPLSRLGAIVLDGWVVKIQT
ncbi:interferon lambda receptor 1 [Astyanax mexicanus]|uniref:interferon lambda receptor 1 n=1 Tax=Astyanax mexicanus TaxID=7994 RepID=UPI0020CAC397|nr:interferon lambda receptor 1 [Astyanax mexicanus]